MKRVLSRLGINCTVLSCSYRDWQQAHCVLACLHRQRLPYLPELAGDVLVPHPRFESCQAKDILEAWLPMVVQVCAEVGELDIAANLLEGKLAPTQSE